MENECFEWPKDSHGKPKPVAWNPVLELNMCQSCWDGKHSRNGCSIVGCQCGCYAGRNKGLSKINYPRKDCEENQEFPNPGGFDL